MIHTIETRLKLNETQELLVDSCVVLWSSYYRKTWKLWNNQQLKENEITKNIPVVIMSASRGLEHTAIQSGANAFIAKPFEIDEVVNKLNQLTA